MPYQCHQKQQRLGHHDDAAGGHGAVREAAEFILDAQGHLEALFAAYLDPQ